jgi:UDP-glucose 4-epimerase
LFDNLFTGLKEAIKLGPFEQIDLSDKADVDHVFQKYSPVAVVDFAALDTRFPRLLISVALTVKITQ